MPWLSAIGAATVALLALTLPALFIAKLPLPYQVKRFQITFGTLALLVWAVLYGWSFGEPKAPALWLAMGLLLISGLVLLGLAVKSARQDGLSFGQMSGWLLPVLGIVLFVMVLMIFAGAIAHV